MKYRLRCVVFILTLFSCSVFTCGQAAIFEKYRFEEGGYTLAGIFLHYDNHPLQKKVGEFYTNDLSVLNAVKKAWVFKKPQHQYACGYHYEIILLRNGKELDSFPINLECNELVTSKGSVYFDLKKLEDFAPRFKSLKEETRQFQTVDDARRTLDKISKMADFVYARPPRWLSYEGKFKFKVNCPSDLGEICYFSNNSDRLISRLKSEVATKYPNEAFELIVNGGMTGGIAFVEVKCNKSLEEKFDLYDRWGKTNFGKWEPYHLSLTWYRKVS